MKFSVHVFFSNPRDLRCVGFVDAESVAKATEKLGLTIEPESGCSSMKASNGRRLFVEFREDKGELKNSDDLRSAADKLMQW